MESVTKPDPIKIDTPKVVMIVATGYEAIPPTTGIGSMVIGSTFIVG